MEELHQRYGEKIENFQIKVSKLEEQLSIERKKANISQEKMEKKMNKSDDIIKRQTANIGQLVKVAQELREQNRELEQDMIKQNDEHQCESNDLKKVISDKDACIKNKNDEISQLRNELDELQAYSSHIEVRYKEASDAEDASNRKVLSLLQEIQNLTKENQRMLIKESGGNSTFNMTRTVTIPNFTNTGTNTTNLYFATQESRPETEVDHMGQEMITQSSCVIDMQRASMVNTSDGQNSYY